MKKRIVFWALTLMLAAAGGAFAYLQSGGTTMYDGNMITTPVIGWDSAKVVSKTLTGSKPSYGNISTVSGTNQLQIICVVPSTGALAAGRLKMNGTGTEIPIYGATNPFILPKNVTFLSFNKYSTATATDAVKCTAVGN